MSTPSDSAQSPVSAATLDQALPTPTHRAAAKPRFDGPGLAVPLAGFSKPDRSALEALYTSIAPVAEPVEGAAPFSLPDFKRAVQEVRAAGEGLANGPVIEALHAVRGGRFQALATLGAMWGRGRVTRELHEKVEALAGEQRRIMRCVLGGLDDARLAQDRAPRPQPLAAVLAHWSRPTSDDDAHGLTLTVVGGHEGPVAGSAAELTALTIAVQAVVSQAEAHAPRAEVFLLVGTAGPGGALLRIAAVTGRGGAGKDPVGAALRNAVVSRAFGLPAAKEALDAGLVGERELEGGFAAWVHWPSLP